MKTRVNSKINNTKGKASNSFRTKIQGYGRTKREDAIGYCSFHSNYINEKTLKSKHCNTCDRFIAFIKKEIKKIKNC